MRSVTMLSDLELAILGFLKEAPRSGYELRKVFGASQFSDSPGVVYPALQRLSRAALLEGASDESTRRGTERFHVTAAGRKALREALLQPVSEEEIRRKPDTCLLRLRFLEPAAAAEFLTEYARLCAKRAAELKATGGILESHEAAVYATRARSAAKLAKSVSRRRG